MKKYTLVEVLDELKDGAIDFICGYVHINGITYEEYKNNLDDDFQFIYIQRNDCFFTWRKDWIFIKNESEKCINFCAINTDTAINLSQQNSF